MDNFAIDIDQRITEIPADYNSSYPEFRLNNENNRLNCYANAILQVLWNVSSLKDAIELYSRIPASEKKSKEFVVMDCV